MTEYKYITLEDTADPESTLLKRVVDGLEPIPRKYIHSLVKKGKLLEVHWNTWKPTAADRPGFQNRICAIAGAEDYENVVEPQFVLAPSLQATLRKARDVERVPGQFDGSFEDLEQLHLWGLANVDYDFDYIDQRFKSASEAVLYFKKSLVSVSVTAKGRKYLEQGFLEGL